MPAVAREGGCVGIVLAGGASRRFGRDKARVEIAHGERLETLTGWAFRRLGEVCAEVAVADAGRGLVAGARSLTDGPGRGPAAGLLGAARAFPARSLLVLACDLPALPVALLARIAELGAVTGADLVIPRREGRAEPLAGLYAPRALAELEERVAEGRFALHDLAAEPELIVRTLDELELAQFGVLEEIFANVNTPEDLARWQTQDRAR